MLLTLFYLASTQIFMGKPTILWKKLRCHPPQSSHGHSLASMGETHTHTQIPSYYHRYPSLQANVLPLPTMCQLGSYSVPFSFSASCLFQTSATRIARALLAYKCIQYIYLYQNLLPKTGSKGPIKITQSPAPTYQLVSPFHPSTCRCIHSEIHGRLSNCSCALTFLPSPHHLPSGSTSINHNPGYVAEQFCLS